MTCLFTYGRRAARHPCTTVYSNVNATSIRSASRLLGKYIYKKHIFLWTISWNTEHERLTTIENVKIKLHSLAGSIGGGNVRHIDVSNEEHWAPLIHWWDESKLSKAIRQVKDPLSAPWSSGERDAARAEEGAAAPPRANCGGDAQVQLRYWRRCGVKKDKNDRCQVLPKCFLVIYLGLYGVIMLTRGALAFARHRLSSR